MADDLIIKIGASSKQYTDELDKVKDQTESLEGQLATIGKASGLAFAGLTGAIGLSVAAFRESEQVAFQTEAILKATGHAAGVTAQQMEELSTAISRNSTFDDEAVKSSGNLLLSFKNLGQDVIPRTMQSVADLSVLMKQDLNTSALQLGKALNDPITGMQQLKKAGILFTDEQKEQAKEMLRVGNLHGAQALILKEVEAKTKGLAAATAQGTGVFLQLQVEIGNLVEEFGKHFAPALIMAATKLKEMVIWVQQHPEILKFAAALTAGAVATTGLTAALSAGALAFIQIRAAMIAANVTAGVLTFSMRALAGSTGIGLLVAGVSYLALNWDSASDAMRRYLGLAPKGKDLGLGQFGPPEPAKKPTGIEALAGDGEELAKKKQAHEEKVALILAQNDEIQKLEKEAQEISRALAEETNQSQRALLQEKLNTNFAMQDEAMARDYEQKQIFQDSLLAKDAEFQAMTAEQQASFRAQNEAKLREEIATKQTIEKEATTKRLKDKIATDKKFLEDEAEFGTAYAALNQMMHSKIVQGTASAFSNLTQLTQSKNNDLKNIGKAAAIANIVVQTAQAAMNIFTGFSVIPFIGTALGIAGAAAAIAFGAEQIGTVTAAARGGIMTGGIAGVDSIPTLTMPGELVVPTQNFEEVISAVADKRSGVSDSAGGGGGGGGTVNVLIGFTRDASRIITAQVVQDRDLGTYRSSR